MTRASSAPTPKSRGKRESNTNNSKAKKKGKGKRGGDEGRPSGAQGNAKKMDSPAVQRAKRDIKIRRLTQVQINALEKAFDDANGKLGHPQKVEIAKGIGLEARQVAIWFQNRRAKWRTEQVENQYDVLKQQNDRLSDENDALRRELEDMRVALAAARAGSSHPMAGRMEVVAGTGGAACYRSKNGESPASVLEKFQHLFRSMKRKRSAFSAVDARPVATWQDSTSSDGGEWESADSASDESSGTESSEEEKQPVKRARRSALQKREFTPPSKATPNGVGKRATPKRNTTPPEKTLPPRRKDPPRGKLQREISLGRPSTLQRRGSKLEALKLPGKLNAALPLFADKDPFNAAPTPKMGGPFKPGGGTPGSTPSMLLGPALDPSPTTGPLANGKTNGGEAGISAGFPDKLPPPSAVGRGFSHLVYGAPQSSSTESTPSLTAYFFPEAMQSAGGGAGAGKTTPPGPREDAALLQLAPPPSDSWGEALLQAEQQRSQAATSQPPAGQGLKSEEVTELPTEVPCDFSLGDPVGGKDYGRSPPPSPLRQFPNTVAQDFLAKYRAAYGEISRTSNEAPRRGDHTLLAFVNGTGDQSAKDEWRQGGDGLIAEPLEGGGMQLEALAILDLAGGGEHGAQHTPPEDSFLELSLDSFGGLGQARALLAEAAARGPPPAATPGVFRGGSDLPDPYHDHDPPFPEPSVPRANGQHQGGHVFLDLEEQDERPPEMAGPLTPRLGGQVQHSIPPWLTAVANGLWGDSGSPGAHTMACWTQVQTGQ